MTREPDFNELVGGDLDANESERLRHAHELLLAAGPVPELPPGLDEPSLGGHSERREQGAFQLLPRRRVGAALALAAAIALIAFVGGYVAGFSAALALAAAIALIAFVGGYVAGFRHDGFAAQYSVAMYGTAATAASAQIQIGKRDARGNWPLRLEVKGLPKLKNGGYYEMYLTRGKHIWTCGTFAAGGPQTVKVRLTVPYDFKNGDGWIVTKELPGSSTPGPTVLTT
jgi:hypothetical protein